MSYLSSMNLIIRITYFVIFIIKLTAFREQHNDYLDVFKEYDVDFLFKGR